MAGIFHPTRGGNRGGQDQFKWDDVKDDKDRECYLGHSVMAPVGRWQKGKDLVWYTRDKNKDGSSSNAPNQELKSIKEIEAQAMAAALGHGPVMKDKDPLTKEDMNEVLKRRGLQRDAMDIDRVVGMGYKGHGSNNSIEAGKMSDLPFQHPESIRERKTDVLHEDSKSKRIKGKAKKRRKHKEKSNKKHKKNKKEKHMDAKHMSDSDVTSSNESELDSSSSSETYSKKESIKYEKKRKDDRDSHSRLRTKPVIVERQSEKRSSPKRVHGERMRPLSRSNDSKNEIAKYHGSRDKSKMKHTTSREKDAIRKRERMLSTDGSESEEERAERRQSRGNHPSCRKANEKKNRHDSDTESDNGKRKKSRHDTDSDHDRKKDKTKIRDNNRNDSSRKKSDSSYRHRKSRSRSRSR